MMRPPEKFKLSFRSAAGPLASITQSTGWVLKYRHRTRAPERSSPSRSEHSNRDLARAVRTMGRAIMRRRLLPVIDVTS
jgi:hypothetical protein